MKIKVLMLLVATVLFSKEIKKDEIKNYFEKNSDIVNTYTNLENRGNAKTITNYDEVLMNHIYKHRKESKDSQAEVEKRFGGKEDKEKIEYGKNFNKKVDPNIEKFLEALNKEVEEEKFEIRTFGYCTIPHDIEISKIAEIVYVQCDLNGVGRDITVSMNYVPDFYSEAIIGRVLSVNHPELKNLNVNSVVLNASRTSMNLANVINDHKLEKILSNLSYKSATLAAQKSAQYLSQVEASNQVQEVAIVPGQEISEAVKTTNTKEPDLKIYLKQFGIELVSEIIKEIAESKANEVSYVFKMNRGAVHYIDVTLDNKTKPYNSLKIGNENLIIKQKPLINIPSENNKYDYRDGIKKITIERPSK